MDRWVMIDGAKHDSTECKGRSRYAHQGPALRVALARRSHVVRWFIWVRQVERVRSIPEAIAQTIL
jgi:hypothetical protein